MKPNTTILLCLQTCAEKINYKPLYEPDAFKEFNKCFKKCIINNKEI